MSGQNKNREKEEKLFRALSGVDEELLLQSEQSNGTKKQKENGKIHRFPLHYASRIAAACLCFVAAGVLYMTMSGTKMADSTGADMAAQAVDTAAAQQQVYEAAEAAREENEAAPAERAENAMAEVTTDVDGFATENVQQAAQNSDNMDQKQGSEMSADTDSVASVSGNETSGAEDSMEASEEQTEGMLTEKEVRPPLRKMTTKGQQ